MKGVVLAIDTEDIKDADGLPQWIEGDGCFACADPREVAHATAFMFKGFDLPAFDRWLSALEPCGIKAELLERRSLAVKAARGNNEDAVLRHLEWMMLRRQYLDRSGFLLPLAQRDKKRQDGTRKARRAEINEWIDQELARTPDAKSPDLWRRAPGWITDQIGERRFAARVTQRRKTRASK